MATSRIVIVLDMSNPGDVLPYLLQWLNTIREVLNVVLKEVSATGGKKTLERLTDTMDANFRLKHPDR